MSITSIVKLCVMGINNSTWKDKLLPLLNCNYFFNTSECSNSDYLLFVITPKFAELNTLYDLIVSAYNNPSHVIFCLLFEENGHTYSIPMEESLKNIFFKLSSIGVRCFTSLPQVQTFVNSGCTNDTVS